MVVNLSPYLVEVYSLILFIFFQINCAADRLAQMVIPEMIKKLNGAIDIYFY